MDDTFTTPEYIHVPSLTCRCKPRLQGVREDGVLVQFRILHHVVSGGQQVAYIQADPMTRGWSP